MRTAAKARSLDRQYYQNAEFFRLERERLFSQNWWLVGRTADCFPAARQNSSQVLATTVAGLPLLLISSGDSSLRAYHNVCRHRGALLVESGYCGPLSGERVVCPYHAWSYDLNGKLVGAPNMQQVEGFCREEFGLQAIAIDTVAGFVFVNLDPQAQPLAQSLQPLLAPLQSWSVSELKTAGTLSYEVRANWKLLFENYSECYHCPTVHPALNRLTPYRGAANVLDAGPILGGPMNLADGVATMSLDGEAVGPTLPSLGPEELRAVYYFTVMPNFFLSLHPDYVLIHRLEPIDTDRTQVTCLFLVAEPERCELTRAIEFWDLTNRQDWEMCERVQAASCSPAFQPGPLSNLESIVAAWDRHYLKAIGN